MNEEEVTNLVGPFRYLLDLPGFRVTTSFKATDFPAKSVVLSDGDLSVHVESDRGITAAQVSPAISPERWLPLSHLTRIVLRLDPAADVTFDESAQFLKSHFSTVLQMLSPERIEETDRIVLQNGRDYFQTKGPGSIQDF